VRPHRLTAVGPRCSTEVAAGGLRFEDDSYDRTPVGGMSEFTRVANCLRQSTLQLRVAIGSEIPSHHADAPKSPQHLVGLLCRLDLHYWELPCGLTTKPRATF
jgi:hypothetical protein